MYFLAFVLKNLTRRPTRTALTILGLAVAIGSTIALLGMSENFRTAMGDTFAKRGVDLVVLDSRAVDQLSSEIDESALEQVRNIPGVEAVDAALVELTEMQKREPTGPDDIPPSMPVLVQAWLPGNFGFEDMELVAGRRLTAQDVGQHRAIIGSRFAENLGKKVGDKVTILQQPFEIVGIFKTINVFERGGIIVLLPDYQKLSGRSGKITGFSLRVKKNPTNPDESLDTVKARIAALTTADGKPRRLRADSPEQYLENASHLKLVRAMAWMVSAIGILIGVISMLNTMVMSVLERTQEIGILRAVGWPRSRVVRMVLMEAVVLGVVSALIGAVGALVVTHILAETPAVSGFIEGGIPLVIAAEGVVIAALIGLVGGAYPAIRAARLLPTEAIRHD